MIKITIPIQIDRAQEIGQWMNETIGAWPERWEVKHGIEGYWEVTVQDEKSATAVLLRWA